MKAFDAFNLTDDRMPISFIQIYAFLKKAYALHNESIDPLRRRAILDACDEIIKGKFDDLFNLGMWGSATHTNMTVNRIVATRASDLCDVAVDPHDHVNAGQSTNDTFLTVMHICLHMSITKNTIPALRSLIEHIESRASEWVNVVKVGRTHMMDAVPIRLSQEWLAHAANVKRSVDCLQQSCDRLTSVPIGGTAIGSGLNSVGNVHSILQSLSSLTGIELKLCANLLSTQSMLDQVSQAHAALLQVAHALKKFASDVRLQTSGPSAGLNELRLDTPETGSSIMPAKKNTTGAEALIMTWMEIMGADVTVQIAAASGEFQLNVFRPIVLHKCIATCRLIRNAVSLFREEVIARVAPREEDIHHALLSSRSFGTAISPFVGYSAAATAISAARDNRDLFRKWPAEVQRRALVNIMSSLRYPKGRGETPSA